MIWLVLSNTTPLESEQSSNWMTCLQCWNTHSLNIATKVFQLNVMFQKHLLCSLLNSQYNIINGRSHYTQRHAYRCRHGHSLKWSHWKQWRCSHYACITDFNEFNCTHTFIHIFITRTVIKQALNLRCGRSQGDKKGTAGNQVYN